MRMPVSFVGESREPVFLFFAILGVPVQPRSIVASGGDIHAA
jgi:hypothetical protein